MKRRIVFATGNENKMKEIRMILADLGMEIVSMREAGVDERILFLVCLNFSKCQHDNVIK